MSTQDSKLLGDSRVYLSSFLDLEQELGLLDQQIGGIELWERLRVPVYQQVLQETGITGEPHVHARYTLGSYVKGTWMLARNTLYRNPLLSQPCDQLFLGSPRRRLLDDGLWWDIYCDPLIAVMPWSYTYLEAPYANRHFSPSPTKNRKYLDAMRYSSFVGRSLSRGSTCLTQGEATLLGEVEKQIKIRFGVHLDAKTLATRTLASRRTALAAYKRIISRVNPQLAWLVCSYGNETFIESCKALGVPTVELQHGIISPEHLGYSYPETHQRKTTFPDHLFLFGDFWEQGVRFPIRHDRVHVVGYPFLEAQVKRHSGCEKKPQIVFLSEGTIGASLSRLACELAKAQGLRRAVVYKLHPSECSSWQRRYPWLEGSCIRVIDTDEPCLHQLLAESDTQVGVCSTALYEGLAFGLRTFLVDLPGVEHMARLVEAGDAVIVSSCGDLLEKISTFIPKRQLANRYFRQNALENMLSVAEGLLDRRQNDV